MFRDRSFLLCTSSGEDYADCDGRIAVGRKLAPADGWYRRTCDRLAGNGEGGGVGRGGIPRGRSGRTHREIHAAANLERGRITAGDAGRGTVPGFAGFGGTFTCNSCRRIGRRAGEYRQRHGSRVRTRGKRGEGR